MSFLTDTDLKPLICTEKEWLSKDKLNIHPYSEECLTPVGYDLRVGNSYASSFNSSVSYIKDKQKIIVRPWETVLITSLENIGMPQSKKYSAFITSKVSMVSRGLSHISTNIDPDWKGNLLIAIHNPSKSQITLISGEAFCTINFIENKSPSSKKCEKEPGRTDILLNNYAAKSKETIDIEHKHKIKRFAFQGGLVLSFGLIGWWLFGNGPGFIASVAMGGNIALCFPFLINKD